MDNLKISHDIPLINKLSLALSFLNDHEFNGFIPLKWPVSKVFVKDPDFCKINNDESNELEKVKKDLYFLESDFNQILFSYSQVNNFNKHNETNVLIDKITNKIDDIKEPLFKLIDKDKKIEFNTFLRWFLLVMGSLSLSEYNNKDNIERDTFNDHLIVQNIWLHSYSYLCSSIEKIFKERSKFVQIKTNFNDSYMNYIEDKYNSSIIMQFKEINNLSNIDSAGVFNNYLKDQIALEYIESLDIHKIISIIDFLRPNYYYDENKILVKNNLNVHSWWQELKSLKYSKKLFLNSLNTLNKPEILEYMNFNFNSFMNDSDEELRELKSPSTIPDFFEKISNLCQFFPIPNHSQINDKTNLFIKWYRNSEAQKDWEKIIESFKDKIKVSFPENEEYEVRQMLVEAEINFHDLLLENNEKSINMNENFDQLKIAEINKIILSCKLIQNNLYCATNGALSSLPYFERYFMLHLAVLATGMVFSNSNMINENLKELCRNTKIYISLLRVACLERSQSLLNIKTYVGWNEKYSIVNKYTEDTYTINDQITKKTKNLQHAVIQKNYLELKRSYIDYSMLVYYKVARMQSLLNSFPEYSEENIIGTYKKCESISRILMELAYAALPDQKSMEFSNVKEYPVVDLIKIDLPKECHLKNDYFKIYLPDDKELII